MTTRRRAELTGFWRCCRSQKARLERAFEQRVQSARQRCRVEQQRDLGAIEMASRGYTFGGVTRPLHHRDQADDAGES